MTEEQLSDYERCYRNWNGTSVMEGAFANLLSEIHQLRIKVKRQCAHLCRTHSESGWHCPECDMRGVRKPIAHAYHSRIKDGACTDCGAPKAKHQ